MKNNRTFLEKLLDGAEVKWKPLIKVASLTRGRVISKEYLADNLGDYPVYSSQTVNNGEIGKINSFDFDGEFVSWTTDGANAGTVFYRSGKFSITNVCGLIKIQNNLELNYKFLFYWLSIEAKNHVYSGMGNPKLMSHQMEKILIPIPPLPVQTEIVKILDTLTALTSELTSELTLRRKQYEYYREKLLSFDSLEQLNMGGAKKKLIDVAKIKNGKDWKHLGGGDIPIYGSGGIMGYVDTYSYDKPTVLIPRKGTITNIFYLDEPFWNVDTIYYTEIDENQILPKYFYHFMKTVDLTKLDTGSGRPSLTQAILNEILIFVPPPEEQQRIVSILDKFETLTNSITEGLPLAIEQSQKRYEYYRELLLSF
jgi:putative type I restriction enzyme specificity protein